MNADIQNKVSPITSAVDVLRADIDRIDDQILDLLEQRYPLVKRIARAKDIEGAQTLALRPGRERSIVERLSARAARVPASDIKQIWRSIMALSARHQRDYRVLLWGPESARLALSTLAAARYGEAVTIEWAASSAEALEAALAGAAILLIAAEQTGWLDHEGLHLIGRYPTGCVAHPWALEMGRIGASDRETGWRTRVPATGVVACLGGRGSHSEQACGRWLANYELLPLADVASVLRAVREGTADLAVVPIGNDRTGPLPEHRALLAHAELRVVGEEKMEVRQHLLGAPGATLEGIRKVSSHPAALAQCEGWLKRWPWERTAAASTAHAAAQVAGTGDLAWAAIGSEEAAAIHGLEVLAWDLQGRHGNVTAFAIVERRREYA